MLRTHGRMHLRPAVKWLCTVSCTLVMAGIFACDRKGVGVSGTQPLSVAVDTSRGADRAILVVRGFSSDELQLLDTMTSMDAWQSVVRVNVSGNAETAVSGRYQVNDSAVAFEPLFSFDAGRSYDVRVVPRAILPARTDSLTTTIMVRPAGNLTPSTTVLRVLPSGDTVPENLLRLYVEFSAPMSRVSGLDYIKLLDSAGREVPAAFLPVEADFWNDELTRYTLFLDPGRVKRGILPNEQLGRAIHNGGTYTLAIDARWPDAAGRPLVMSHSRVLRVGPVDALRIALAEWKVQAPVAGSRDPLVVVFPKALDHGLLRRSLGVELANGRAIPGTVAITGAEREWRFTPQDTWRDGAYHVVVFSILEDVAGNRIDRPFEVDNFDQIDKSAAPERYRVPFTIRSTGQ